MSSEAGGEEFHVQGGQLLRAARAWNLADKRAEQGKVTKRTLHERSTTADSREA